MPSVTIENFMPANYGKDPLKIMPNEGSTASWTNTEEGVLRQEGGLALTASGVVQPSAETIYWYNREGNGGDGYWLQWSTDVDVVKGPIADDTYKRLYWTGDGYPKMGTNALIQSGSQYPGASRRLGLPAPAFMMADGPDTEPYESTDENNNPITVDPADGNQVISTAYVMTFVSDIGEEGPASAASNIVDRYDGGVVSLTNLSTPSGAYNITKKRIYRTELNGAYQFVAEINASTTSYSDNVESAALGEVLPSDGWIQPHEDMIGLIALPNGILAGFWENTVAFCEPYQPHAWPIEYRYAMDYDVVGLALCASGLVVCTKGNPYIMAGSAPGSMSQNKLEVTYACTSKSSIVDMGDYVVYASTDGLVAVGGTGASLISLDKISRKKWNLYFSYNGRPIKAVKWRDRYLGLIVDSGTTTMFSFHPAQGSVFFFFGDEIGPAPKALWKDPETDGIYTTVEGGNNVYQWGEGVGGTAKWASKIFSMPPSQNFVCAKIRASDYAFIDIKYHVDGLSKKSAQVTPNKPFRLPSNLRGNNCRIIVELYSGEIQSIQLSTSMSELL